MICVTYVRKNIMASGSQLIPAGTDPKSRLITAIRGWIHMDNLAESFSHQASNARTVRSKHETDAITLMKQLGLAESTIQVSGATLQLIKKTTPGGLTWGYLEKEIPAWATRSGLTPAQSQSLLTWLQAHREPKETEYLKKSLKQAELK
jgi:hypothetical protein